jgi:hypothetical protein
LRMALSTWRTDAESSTTSTRIICPCMRGSPID